MGIDKNISGRKKVKKILDKIFFGKCKNELVLVRLCSLCKNINVNWKGCPCKTAWYCDTNCQKKHWQFHKHECNV